MSKYTDRQMFEIAKITTSTLMVMADGKDRLPSPEAVDDIATLTPRQVATILVLAVGAMRAHGDEDSPLMKMAAQATGRGEPEDQVAKTVEMMGRLAADGVLLREKEESDGQQE